MLICFSILYLEPSAEPNPYKINQLEATYSTQYVTSKKETPVDTEVVIGELDHATDANIKNSDTQKGTEELLSISSNMILHTNERNDCIMVIYLLIWLVCRHIIKKIV